MESEKRRSKQRRLQAPTAHSNLDNREDDIATSEAFQERTEEDACADPAEFQADEEEDSREQDDDNILDEYPTIFQVDKNVLIEGIDRMALQRNDTPDEQYNGRADSKMKRQN